MNRTLTTTAAALLLTGLAACSTSQTGTSTAKASASATKALTASTALAQLVTTVPSAKLSGTVTAANDPNHLLGRPSQYTSKVTFTDSRINATDVARTDKGDIDRGGAVEVFTSTADAKARAAYIQTVTKSLPAASEYDFVHGSVLVRVSHYLTPAQAAGYKSAAANLG